MSEWANEDIEFMRLALEQATLASSLGEVPIAALLVRDGEILAKAHNYRELRQDPTAHAEMVAIREAAAGLRSWRLTGATLYVTLEPCVMCMGAVVLSRIARLMFGARDPKAGACGSIFDIMAERRLNHRVEVFGGLLERESGELLQRFFRQLRLDAADTEDLAMS